MNIDEGAMQKFVKEEEVVCQFAKLLPLLCWYPLSLTIYYRH